MSYRARFPEFIRSLRREELKRIWLEYSGLVPDQMLREFIGLVSGEPQPARGPPLPSRPRSPGPGAGSRNWPAIPGHPCANGSPNTPVIRTSNHSVTASRTRTSTVMTSPPKPTRPARKPAIPRRNSATPTPT